MPVANILARPITPPKLPDGDYVGKWCGYEVTVEHGGYEYYFETSLGVRGIDVPCRITIHGDAIYLKHGLSDI